MILHIEAGHFFLHHRLLKSKDDDSDIGSEGGSDVAEEAESNDGEVA